MNALDEKRNVLLEIADLKVHFDIKDGKQWFWQPPKTLKAVDGVTLRLYEGETLGVVGESGCGKSTFARAIIGLVKATDGKVAWLGKDLLGMKPDEWREVRSDIQMIFQDPLASLNPRMTIGEIIAEPLRTYHPKMSRQEVRDRVKAMMMKVGLLPNLINRYPHEFSGGQCQRIGIARALIEVEIVDGGNIPVRRFKGHAEIFHIQQKVILLLRLWRSGRFKNCHDGDP